MISLFQTAYTKKFVVPSVAGILVIASTMILAPVFAGFDNVDIQKISGQLRVSFDADFSSSQHGGAKIFLTNSGGDVKFKCTNPNANANANDKGSPHTKEANFGELEGTVFSNSEGKFKGLVVLGPPSLSAKDLCHTDKLDLKIDSITYNDVILHGIPFDTSAPESIYHLGNVDP